MPDQTAVGTVPLTIQKFDKALHDHSAFSCGHDPIDNFLKKSLSDQVKNGMVTAYLATTDIDKAVLAFYTLSAMIVRADLGACKWKKARVPEVPVIYIRAVAIHKKHQGKGWGTALVINAIHKCIDISGKIGVAASVLDVLEGEHFKHRMAFYESLGFTSLNDPENKHRIFIPMADVRMTLGG